MAESTVPTRDAPPGGPDGSESEVDPELLALRRPRPRAGVLLSLSVVVLCGYLMILLGSDFAYALRDDAPREFDRPADLLAGDAEGAYVRVRAAAPDRAAAARVTYGESAADGRRVAPVLGTERRLWLSVLGSPWSAPVRHDEVYEGRLRRFEDVPFAAPLRDHVTGAAAPRFAGAAAVREALAGGATAVAAPGGGAIAVAPDTRVTVEETVADHVEITALANERRPDENAWARALAGADVVPEGTEAIARGDGRWVFPARGDAGTIGAALADARLLSARAEQVSRTHRARWDGLAAEGDALAIGDRRVAWTSLEGVWLAVGRPVPPGALVLSSGERPADHWFVPPLYAGLGVLAALFAWALVHGIRRELGSTHPTREGA